MNTTLYQNRPGKTQIEQISIWTPWLPDYSHEYYVNIDLRHQYGIPVAESLSRWVVPSSEEKRLFSQANN